MIFFIDFLELLGLIELVNPKAEESSELVEEFFENKVRIELSLTAPGQLSKQISILRLQKEIIFIIDPFEIHICGNLTRQLLVDGFSMVEHPQDL